MSFVVEVSTRGQAFSLFRHVDHVYVGLGLVFGLEYSNYDPCWVDDLSFYMWIIFVFY